MCAAPLLGDGAVLTGEKMRIHPPSSSPITFIASERGGWRRWPFFPPHPHCCMLRLALLEYYTCDCMYLDLRGALIDMTQDECDMGLVFYN